MAKDDESSSHYCPGLKSNKSSWYATTISTSASRNTVFPCAARSGVCITDMGLLIAGGHGREVRLVNVIMILEQAVVPNRTALWAKNYKDKAFLN